MGWTVTVDRTVCMGSGMCCLYAPAAFEVDEETRAVFLGSEGVDLSDVETAVEGCPTGALTLVREGPEETGEKMEAKMRLANKHAVITGAGSGVGRAAALRFVEEGAKVICADIRKDWIDATVELAAGGPGQAMAYPCDVTKESDVAGAIQAAVDTFGRLDIMFNNAGVATPRPGLRLEDHTDEDWDRLMAINLKGVFYGCKHAVIRFKAQGDGGVIVNTGSVAGMVGWGGSIYGTSKAGVNHLTKAVAIEGAADNIRANAICPAAMPGTNFMVPGAERGSQGVGAEQAASVGAVHPLGRPILAEDIAAAAVYLASDEAANVTGVLLPVDGGYVAR